MNTKYLIGVASLKAMMIYYSFEIRLELNTKVIIDNPTIGITVGTVEVVREMREQDVGMYPSILRAATPEDLKLFEKNKSHEKEIFAYVVTVAKRHNLEMKIIQTTMALDASKLLIVYSADERIDFREMVKELAHEFHMRIEMKQIGTRDRAQLVGGIGVCGLKLCCSTFLKNFDVISINMAKNQLLSLNIPKLSGQCGKLICCLKYEDESYTALHREYPRIGDRYSIKNQEYRITGLNLLTGIITLYNGSDYLNLNNEELKKYTSVKPIRKM